jgi:hypothetical protein
MEAKRDLTPLYAILQGKEMDVTSHEPSQSQSLGEVFDHGTTYFLIFIAPVLCHKMITLI